MEEARETSRDHEKTRFFSDRNMKYIMGLCFLSALMWLPRFRGPIDLRWDAGVYYILGTSIAEGKGYRLLSEPGEIEVIQYPPALPMMVALHQWILGTSDYIVVGSWLRLTYFVIFTIYLCAVYWMALRYLSPRFAALASAVCALHLHTYFLSNTLFTEIPFALVSILFILVNRKAERPLYFGLSALLAWCAFLLRTAGIALLCAWIAESLFRRKFKQALVRLIVCLIPVIGWQLYILETKSSEAYENPAYPYQRADYLNYNVGYLENILLVDSFKPELGKASLEDLGNRVIVNAARLPIKMAEQVSAVRKFWQNPSKGEGTWLQGLPPDLVTAILIVFFVLICGGAITLMIQGEWLIPGYVLATLAVICLTPWPGEFPRYMSPVTSLLSLMLFSTLMWAVKCFRRIGFQPLEIFGLALVSILAAIIPVIQSYAAVQAIGGDLSMTRHYDRDGNEIQSRFFYHNSGWRILDEAVEWLRTKAPEDAVICTSAPHIVYLKTGRKTVQPPYEPDPEKARSLIESVPADYVIVDHIPLPDVGRRYAAPALIKGDPSTDEVEAQDSWTLVYTGPKKKLRIFRYEVENSRESPR